MMRSHKSSVIGLKALGIFLLTFWCYRHVLNAGFIWDDDKHVTKNGQLESVHGLSQIWFSLGAVQQYYPLTYSAFWLEHHAWGNRPRGYHFTNILFHALNAILLGFILIGLGIHWPWVCALLFAIHPMNVESVAWISELKNTLSTFFYLMAALQYLAFLSPKRAQDRRIHYGLAFAFFVAALLSKTTACSLPAVLLIILWWKRPSLQAKDVTPLVPFFSVGILLAGVTVVVEKKILGAEGALWHHSLAEHVIIAARAVEFYAVKFIWPHPLSFIYPQWDIHASDPALYLFPVSLAAILAMLIVFRKSIGRGALAGFSCFLVILFPALGFFNLYPMRYSYIADHFAYVALIALIGLTVEGFYWIEQSALFPKKIWLATLSTWVILLCILAAKQTMIYLRPESLWRHTLALNPRSAMALNNLGLELMNQNRFQEARAQFLHTLEIDPRSVEATANLAFLGERQHQPDEAIARYRQSIALDPQRPDLHGRLGSYLLEIGHIPEAIEELEQTLAIGNALIQKTPERLRAPMRFEAAKIHLNLGYAFSLLGKTAKSIEEVKRALALEPHWLLAQQLLKQLQRPKLHAVPKSVR